jgi:iduronate 2-sulfatase
MFWRKWQTNSILKNSHSLSEHFKANGYYSMGSGKMMHTLKKDLWDEYGHAADYGPFWFDGKKRLAHPEVKQPFASIGCVDGSFGPLATQSQSSEGGWIYGSWGQVLHLKYKDDDQRSPTPDEKNAVWAIHKFKTRPQGDKPFFMGVGFIRPHTPMVAPQKYFDLYPLEEVQLPQILEKDLEDTHFKATTDAKSKGFRYYRMLCESYGKELGLKMFTQAYLACVSAVDDCIGTVLEGLKKEGLWDNTIVIVTSDHGWQMGQKDFIFKNSPWEQSTRVPLFIRAPGVSQNGKSFDTPVSLIDIYPTLVDLCKLPKDTMKNERGSPLSGHSMVALLKDPEAEQWGGPEVAISMIFGGPNTPEKQRNSVKTQHYSLRSKDFRYIIYNTGKEELYDHRHDPEEHHNLANKEEAAAMLATMRASFKKWVPQNDDHLKGVDLGTW